MRGKNIWGRKRHLLIDTQGYLLAIKVLAADRSDAEGARVLLEPLKERLPRIRTVWGDSHYGGEWLRWLREHLGWTGEIVKRIKAPKRGLLVEEGEEIDWEKRFPSGFQPLPRRWVEEALIFCEWALTLDPTEVNAFLNKGCSLGELGRNEEALLAFDQALRLTPDDADLFYNKGNSLAAEHKEWECLARENS